ncbi:MAG: hypothetical protein HUU37_04355 [Bdellovibrionales bacterium]|nr:hypothetical protein [Bdellovibrionales bacterium]
MKLIFGVLVAMVFLALGADAAESIRQPNVSADALFLHRRSNFGRDESGTTRNGLDLREAEIAFYADVDPYSNLNLLLSLHPEYTLNSTTGKVEQAWKFEPEELYVQTNQIPGTTVKVGKFKAAFGKHNTLHTHSFPFVDAPVTNEQLLGGEGINDVGLSAAVLLPTPWFLELTGQYLRGEGENAQFNSPAPTDFVGVARLRNLWDLSDALTFELGGSYARGNNSLRANTAMAGTDLTFKWRPSGGSKALVFAAEGIQRRVGQPGASMDEKGRGWNVWGKYQFTQRWAVLARQDVLRVRGADSAVNANALENRITRKYTAGLIFVPTEFSSLQAEYSLASGPVNATTGHVERKYYLQANFAIGAHPAHAY